MAVTLRSVFFAVTAAMVLSLSACGGGGSGGEGDQTPTPVTTSPPTTVVPDPATPVTVPPVPVVLTTQAIASAPAETSPVLRSAVRSSQTTAPVIASPSVSFAVGGVAKALPLSATTSTARVITGTQLMNFVEGAIPSLFPEHAADREISGGGVVYQWRWYSNGNILAVGSDGNIYGLGPYVGSDTTAHLFGTLTQFTCVVDVEMCRPRVVAELVTPRNGAVDVPLTGAVITVPFDQPLADCPVTTVGIFGAIQGTLSCVNSGTTATVTITAAELPENSLISVTLGGFRSVEGYEMIGHTWSFTTVKKPVVVPVVRIVTANTLGYHDNGGGASIIDPATKAITHVVLDRDPGDYLLAQTAYADGRVAYIGEGVTNVLHRFDPVTGKNLPSFYIGATRYEGNGIRGIAHNTSTKTVCVATSLWAQQATVSFLRNRLICFDPVTGNKVFNSPDDFLGNATMMVTKMIYAHGKFYVLMATESGLVVELDWYGYERDGYKPGTPGMVVEIDATTYQKGRTWNVKSMPMDVRVFGNTLYVVNAGDKSLSKIDLSVVDPAKGVTTIDWTALFTGYAKPTNVEIDPEKGVYYISDWESSVRVMSLATDQQVGSIVLVGMPRGMGIVAGSLWVATLTLTVNMSEIDRTARTVKSTLTGVGKSPWDVAIYDNTKP